MVSRTAISTARYAPWQHLLETDVTLVLTPLLGTVDAVVTPQGIALNSTLSKTEQRCALAIALAHVEKCPPEMAELVAARRLIPLDALLGAQLHVDCLDDLADLLRVTPHLLALRLREPEVVPE